VLSEGRSTIDWDAIELRRHVGYVLQTADFSRNMTVKQNVGLVLKLQDADETRNRRPLK